MPTHSINSDSIIRPRDTAQMLGIALSTLYKLISKQRFPAPEFRLSSRCVGWRASTIQQFIQSNSIQNFNKN